MTDSAFPVVPGGRRGSGNTFAEPQPSALRILSYVYNSFSGGAKASGAPLAATAAAAAAASAHTHVAGGGSAAGGLRALSLRALGQLQRALVWLLQLARRAAGAAARPLTVLSNQQGVVLFALAYYVLHRMASASDGGDKKKDGNGGTKVAVVGGGIAGLGAAWALHRSGFEVTVFEKKPTLGGNAKAHNWIVTKDDGSPAIVRTGLSVLAWPREFFNNYNNLMADLDIDTVDHDLRFCVGVRPTARSEPELVYVHGRESHTLPSLVRNDKLAWLATDLTRWNRLTRAVRFVNGLFSAPPANGGKSLYRVNMFNPLNVLPLRWAARAFGVSRKFWDEVFVPVHTSTFLEADMNDLPAIMAEVLEDIVPLSDPTVAPSMATWKAGNGDQVFERMVEGFADRVHTSDEVEAVRFVTRPNGRGGTKKMAQVAHYHSDPNRPPEEFDHVVFACSAPASRRILDVYASDEPSFLGGLKDMCMHWLAKQVLSRVMYTESRDVLFQSGEAHSDINAVFPAPLEREIVQNYCNYIECTPQLPDPRVPGSETTYNYENTFILSSWCPPAVEACKDEQKRRPMLVSYNCRDRLDNIKMEDYERTVTGREAHPSLTISNMALSNVLWPRLQGLHNNVVFFAGSAMTPGNGHDLSFLSGLIIAKKLGADYPFADNPAAAADFERLRKLMGVSIP